MRRFWILYCSLPAVLLGLFISIFISPSLAAAPGKSYGIEGHRFHSSVNELYTHQVFEAVNKIRHKYTIAGLRADPLLENIAISRAQDMASKNYYAHRSLEGLFYYDHLKIAGIHTGYSCENLELIFIADISQIMSDWSNSQKGHRECLLDNRVNAAGYGVARLSLVDARGAPSTAYIIVAIHAQLP